MRHGPEARIGWNVRKPCSVCINTAATTRWYHARGGDIQFRSLVRSLFVWAVLAIAGSPTGNASTIQLRASLNGAKEAPPVATAATGMAIVTYDTVSGQLSWNVAYSGLSSS